MKINIQINNQPFVAREGETILEILTANGFRIPTLCHLAGILPNSSCRMCVVEIKGEFRLLPACSSQVVEGMEIFTHSERVIQARRTNLMLLLASHPDDCLNCERNTRCDLQLLAGELNISEKRFRKTNYPASRDLSSPSVCRDFNKCIRCGRCVEICDTVIGCQTFKFSGAGSDYSVRTAFEKALNLSNCVQCGQCVLHCPTAALTEKSFVQKVVHEINSSARETIAIVEPAAAYAVMQLYSTQSLKNTEEFTAGLLKRAGFAKVFSSGYGNDLMMNETIKRLQHNLSKGIQQPIITSSCPAWVRYAEQHLPELLPLLNRVKSGPQLLASLIHENSETGKEPFVVLITTCTGRKMEATRIENQKDGKAVIDAVLNIRDIERLVALRGIDTEKSGIQPYDNPYARRSSSSVLCSISGGESEGIIRYYLGKENPQSKSMIKINELRAAKSIKEALIPVAQKENIKICAISGLSHIEAQIHAFTQSEYNLIEVMACPGGCISGGGRSYTQNGKYSRQVIRAIYESDTRDILPFINIPQTKSNLDLEESGQTHQMFNPHEVIR